MTALPEPPSVTLSVTLTVHPMILTVPCWK